MVRKLQVSQQLLTPIKSMKRSTIFFSTLCGIILCLSALTCRGEIDSGLTRVNALLYQHDYVEAEILLKKLYTQIDQAGSDLNEKEKKQRLIILDRLGKVYALYLRNYKKAIEHYNLLIKDYPETDEAFAARSVLADLYHHKLDNINAAISQYRKTLEFFPRHPEAPEIQLKLVRLYMESKDFSQTRSEVQSLLAQWPNTKHALHAEFQIGMTYYLESRYSEAITTFETLLKKTKNDPDLSALISFELGNSYESIDEPDKAIEQFYACLAKHPNPLLVQRRIRRARKRIRQVKPSARIYSQYSAPLPSAANPSPNNALENDAKESTTSTIMEEPSTQAIKPETTAPQEPTAKTEDDSSTNTAKESTTESTPPKAPPIPDTPGAETSSNKDTTASEN